MARIITQGELRNYSARVIDAVAAGESFVVTRNGIPVAELRPIERPRSRFVARETLAALGAAGPHVDLADFKADLDRTVDHDLSMSLRPARGRISPG
ncbi:MAG: type II toxin-antitoxin system Phd/YefM family antitoxin [Acidimicrobiales bacterium]